MLPLSKQVQIASDFARGTTARLAGAETPSWEDTEKTMGDLVARVRGGDAAGGAEAAARAEALNPDLAMATGLRAECEFRLGRPCEALRLAERVTLDDPGERLALDRLREAARAACGPSQ